MPHRRLRMLLASAIITGAVAALLTAPDLSASAHPVRHGIITMCRTLQRMLVTSGHATYILRNDNYAHQPECLTNSNHSADFVVSESDAKSIHYESMAYPEIMLGCAWGLCTPGTSLPTRVSALRDPESTWYITATARGQWNAGYDLWFAHRDFTSGQDKGAELMVWLRCTFPPPERKYVRLVRVHGIRYWLEHWTTHNPATGIKWRYILFRRFRPATHVRDLKFLPFIRRAERGGLLERHLWLTSIDAGFEIWSGGQGLTTDRYWVKA